MAALVIIGGGIEGLALALEAATGSWSAANGHQVIVLRRPDTPSPNAETLRNQAWWQSGLHYARKGHGAHPFAQTLAAAADLLHTEYQLELPSRGVMRVAGADLFSFVRAAHALGMVIDREHRPRVAPLLRRVTLLGRATAQKLVGASYGNDGHYFQVPDQPFAEANILVVMRDRLRGLGVEVREVAGDGAVLVPRAETPCGCVIGVDGIELAPDAVVVAAGCATPQLLEQLGLRNHGFTVEQTPLLVVKRHVFDAPLVADYVKGWSATQPLRGRYVFGGKPRPGSSPRAGRTIDPQDEAHLLAEFHRATGIALAPGEYAVSAGQEIWHRDAAAPQRASAWIGADSSYPRVAWVVPGRACLAVAVARRTVAMLVAPRADATNLIDRPGTPWTGPIALFAHPYYDPPPEEAP